MPDRSLHQTLKGFTEDAALQLAADSAGGADVPFEMVQEPGRRGALSYYRPLTAEFVRQRMGSVGRLPSYAQSAAQLQVAGGLDTYLEQHDVARVPTTPRDRADATLRIFLTQVFDGMTEFTFPPERFEQAFAELADVLTEGVSTTTVLVPVLGLALASDEVALGGGLTLLRGDRVPDAPPEAVWTSPLAPQPSVLAVLTGEGEPDQRTGPDAIERFRRLITALRLYEGAGFALGPVAWMHRDAEPWTALATASAGGADALPFVLDESQEDELRGFVNLVGSRRPERGPLAWALRRFERGCECADPAEGLTDHLLALRALLEPDGRGAGRLGIRLAAICAPADDRPSLQSRIALAESLERALRAGVDPIARDAEPLVHDVAEYLRALLRDVLCGHLDRDLVRVAEDLLAADATGGDDEFGITPDVPDRPRREPVPWL